MTEGLDQDALNRIAGALERLSPAPRPDEDLTAHRAYHWDGSHIGAIADFRPLDFDLLCAIDDQKARALENSARLAKGHAAHDVLLWGSRGMGKSALIKSVIHMLQEQGQDIALIETASDHLDSLPDLFDRLRGSRRPYIIFVDDISFDETSPAPRQLRSLLEGGASARPENVRLYATSNRRHIVARNMAEQDDPINPRDVVDDRLALSDRFGLRLGFHAATQDDYLAMTAQYAQRFDLPHDPDDALLWAKQRGSRSGRIAWQYTAEIAGRAGKAIG